MAVLRPRFFCLLLQYAVVNIFLVVSYCDNYLLKSFHRVSISEGCIFLVVPVFHLPSFFFSWVKFPSPTHSHCPDILPVSRISRSNKHVVRNRNLLNHEPKTFFFCYFCQTFCRWDAMATSTVTALENAEFKIVL